VHACFDAEAVDVRRPRSVVALGEPNVVVGEQPLLRASVLVDLLEASARGSPHWRTWCWIACTSFVVDAH
jgi:hypothetical protein